ncbi:hypothetical protein [Actinomadura chokoriensis]|uniref:NACHT N-terminal helical domain 7-containing protein n=1 Tax=Actinomadura chokoriensis TaxID=454156 RepID=UPI003D156AB5
MDAVAVQLRGRRAVPRRQRQSRRGDVYAGFADALIDYLEVLAVWDRLDDARRGGLRSVLRERVPARAVRRYEDRSRRSRTPAGRHRLRTRARRSAPRAGARVPAGPGPSDRAERPRRRRRRPRARRGVPESPLPVRRGRGLRAARPGVVVDGGARPHRLPGVPRRVPDLAAGRRAAAARARAAGFGQVPAHQGRGGPPARRGLPARPGPAAGGAGRHRRPVADRGGGQSGDRRGRPAVRSRSSSSAGSTNSCRPPGSVRATTWSRWRASRSGRPTRAARWP